MDRSLEDIFAELHSALPEHVLIRHFKSGESIVREDHDGDEVYLIRSGSVHLEKANSLGGSERLVLREGQLIGEQAFLLNKPRTATLVADEAVECWAINANDMATITEHSPHKAAEFYRALGFVIAQRYTDDQQRRAEQEMLHQGSTLAVQLVVSESDKVLETLQRELMPIRFMLGEYATEANRAGHSIEVAQLQLLERENWSDELSERLEVLFDKIPEHSNLSEQSDALQQRLHVTFEQMAEICCLAICQKLDEDDLRFLTVVSPVQAYPLIQRRVSVDAAVRLELFTNLRKNILKGDKWGCLERLLRWQRNQLGELTRILLSEWQAEVVAPREAKILSAFERLNILLRGVWDFEQQKRAGIEIGHRWSAFLSGTEFWRQRSTTSGPGPEPLYWTVHIMRDEAQKADVFTADAISQLVERLLLKLSTVVAVRERFQLTSEVFSQLISKRQNANVTLIYDHSGLLLARTYSKMSLAGGNLILVNDNSQAFLQSDYGIDVRPRHMNLHFAYLRQILDLCRDDEPISLSQLYEQQRIPLNKQDVIVINALIDYLPDRWVYRLVLSCFEELSEGGCVVLSSVLSSEHDAVCTALFQWYMVRRSEQDLRQLFSSMGVECELHIGQHAIVSVLHK